VDARHEAGHDDVGKAWRACADFPHMAMIAAFFSAFIFVRTLP